MALRPTSITAALSFAMLTASCIQIEATSPLGAQDVDSAEIPDAGTRDADGESGDGSSQGTECTGPPYGTCSELFSCYDECGRLESPTDQVLCQSGCLNGASDAVMDDFNDVLTCYQKCAQKKNEEHAQCLADDCPGLIAICFYPGSDGDGACGEILGCIHDAGGCEGGGVCLACAQSGTLDAQIKFVEWWLCLNARCGPLSGQERADCYAVELDMPPGARRGGPAQCTKELLACTTD